MDGKLELILRANKDAVNAGVKAAAAEDSHEIWAEILVDPENPDEIQAAEDLPCILQGNGLKQSNVSIVLSLLTTCHRRCLVNELVTQLDSKRTLQNLKGGILG
mgnify:CR=1 FL=1